MLTASDALRQSGRRRPPPSLKQRYDEYVLRRIEDFKNSISRDELMRFAGEAAAELYAGDDTQFVLTEMLMHEMVDELIKRRLKLKSFSRWKATFAKRSEAQREPTHWGLDTTCPVVHLLPRLEPSDLALTIGLATELPTYLVLAHDVGVIHWCPDMGQCERMEQRCTTETVAADLVTYTVQLATWIPATPRPLDLVVIDLSVMDDLCIDRRYEVLRSLQERTREQGVHVLLPSASLVPEALFTFYEGWKRESAPRRRKGPRPVGQVLTRPATSSFRRAARA